MAAMMTVCNPGDKVIVFSPFYENYGADAILSGAEPIYVPLVPPTFNYDSKVLEDAFRQHPKAIIVCNPSNPCGKVFTREELTEILGYAEKYDAFVITDEVYEHIVFPPYEHVAAASLPGGRSRVITCNSLSKTFSITGWRLGFLIAPPDVPDLAEGVKKVHDFLTVGAPAPLQEAVCAGFTLGKDYYDGLTEMYSRKREIFCKGLDEIGLKHTTPQGSYFIMVDISDFLAKEKFKGWSDQQFCEWMIGEVGVAAVPGSSFFREPVNHLIRLHFARSEESLKDAIARLGKLQKYLKERKRGLRGSPLFYTEKGRGLFSVKFRFALRLGWPLASLRRSAGPTSTVGSAEASTFGPRLTQSVFRGVHAAAKNGLDFIHGFRSANSVRH